MLASESRLRLLWEMMNSGEKSVGALGRSIGISDQNASIQLRLLNSRGIITPYRQGKKLFYHLEANRMVDDADELLQALWECHRREIPIPRVMRSATAFTHERRIRIVQALQRKPLGPAEMEEMTGIGLRALHRHLSKLESRGFLKSRHGRYRLRVPKDPLSKCLLNIVCERGKTSHIKIIKIVSGGQTGADRAALDAALECGVPHGGWCPKGRLAEDGIIPLKYNLTERATASYSERTKANVADADLTLIFSHGPLTGGSLLTQQFAEELGKPCVHMDLNIVDAMSSSRSTYAKKRDEDIASTFRKHSNIVLNVAGPRASGDPQIYDAVYEQMMKILFYNHG